MLVALPAGAASYSIDGTTWQSSNTFTVPAAATSYPLYVKTAAGCLNTQADAVTVAVNPLPDAPTGASSNARCGAGTVTFSANAGGNTIDWYDAPTGGSTVTGGYDKTSFSPTIGSSTTYYAQARNTTTGCVSATRTPVTATVNPLPDTPTGASTNSRCGSGTVTFSASAAGNTIDWYTLASGGSTVTGGYNVLSFSPSIDASTTYYAQARNSSGCVSTSRLPVTGVVNIVPTITPSGGNASQIVNRDLNEAITAIVYTASDAAVISKTDGSFPSNVIGTPSGSPPGTSYTISGTPTQTGKFGYVLTATVNGCTSTAASGTITVTVTPPPDVASTNTWTVGTQIWSDALKKAQPGCSGTSNFGEGNVTNAYYYPRDNGYWYNWVCVNGNSNSANTNSLCPSPWRVPTVWDFIALDQAFGGDGSNRTDNISYISTNYISTWGGAYNGYISGTLVVPGSYGYYWTSTYAGDNGAYSLQFYTNGSVRPQNVYGTNRGVQVRCVRDN
jgi:uncharacterized protein (TIGR02145 family)